MRGFVDTLYICVLCVLYTYLNRSFIIALIKPHSFPLSFSSQGFRADPKAHRRVADSYGLGKDNDKDKEKEKEKEKEEEGMLFGEEEDGEGGAGEDVEALLLSGRASFVSLSSRLRRDAWGEVCVIYRYDDVCVCVYIYIFIFIFS